MIISREIVIENQKGLHARPSSAFVKVANLFDSKINVSTKEKFPVDGKSIMILMTLAAGKGTALIIEINGDDAEEAIDAIHDLIRRKFNEV